MPTVIDTIEALCERLQRARVLVSEGRVHPVLGALGHYIVESSTGRGFYLVNIDCTCPDAQHRAELNRGLCKHKLAVVLYQESEDAAEQMIRRIPVEHATPAEVESLYGPQRERRAA